jgi:hypothetical protein
MILAFGELRRSDGKGGDFLLLGSRGFWWDQYKGHMQGGSQGLANTLLHCFYLGSLGHS